MDRMAEVKLSHPDKVLFPDDGLTKTDLADYYAAVADTMLPHLKDRPMNLWRWNTGIQGQRVVQQDIPKGAPEWVARVETQRRQGGTNTHAMVQDSDTLRWLAQVNCITIHVWTARRDNLDKPDRLVFDLDPEEGSDFTHVREAALAVGERLRAEGLHPFAMVSGSKGIHVVAPLKRTRESLWVRERAGELGAEIAAGQPDTLTTEWRKNKREGRILVDTARNTYGQTVVAPYAVRALPGAPVATPLEWDELEDPDLSPQRWTMKTLPRRLEEKGDPWAEINRHAATMSG
jgi:bifunctional non-homologous end joining protein LigD